MLCLGAATGNAFVRHLLSLAVAGVLYGGDFFFAFDVARLPTNAQHSLPNDVAPNLDQNLLRETGPASLRGVGRMSAHRKELGQFFTPESVARTLVSWAVQKPSDRLLDPSCGDGEFLACHRRSVGIEIDAAHGMRARQRAPGA